MNTWILILVTIVVSSSFAVITQVLRMSMKHSRADTVLVSELLLEQPDATANVLYGYKPLNNAPDAAGPPLRRREEAQIPMYSAPGSSQAPQGTTSTNEHPETSVFSATDSRLGATVHVCLCSDDLDFRPTIAAIRSAMASSASSHRLVFHFITTPELHPVFEKMAGLFLAGVRLEVHSDAKVQNTIKNRLAKAAAKAVRERKALLSVFNFAPFYLPEFLRDSPSFFHSGNESKKLIYLDSDLLSLGDLAELHDQDLDDQPCAAVPYCELRLEQYVDFKVLADLNLPKIDPKACTANRGLMVINLPVWRRLHITRSIEQWLQRYADLDKPLWAGAMSQPPWLLALNGKYFHLRKEWNCDGLSREGMVPAEVSLLRQQGLTSQNFKQLNVNEVGGGSCLEPWLSTCSRQAKILHFNGGMKPWLLAKEQTQIPVCELPEDLDFAKANFSWMKNLTVTGGNDTVRHLAFVQCADIFWQFVEKKPREYFSEQAESKETRERLQDAMYFASRLKKVRSVKAVIPSPSGIHTGSSIEAGAREKMRLIRAAPPADEILPGGFKRATMVAAVSDLFINGVLIVPAGGKGLVVGKARTRQKCTRRVCTASDPEQLVCWFRHRLDRSNKILEVLPEEVRKLSKDEITKNDLSWKYRHLQS